MKKEYVRPMTLAVECQVEKLMAVSGDPLRTTNQTANDDYEVLGRDNRPNSPSLWD